jgi:hypothetical protein
METITARVHYCPSPPTVSVTRVVGNRPGNPGKHLKGILEAQVTTPNWNTLERIIANSPVIERAKHAPGPRRRG